ncbi:MAG TPA: hypothetical protein VN958_12285 [Chitinophagaceae bacterium]|nr:hypothetical protein [Chitinophagaceae bacterium]
MQHLNLFKTLKVINFIFKYTGGWNGTYNNLLMPLGAYIYVLKYKNSTNEQKYKTLAGSFELLR